MTSITGQLFPQKKKHQIRQRKNWIQNVIFSQRVHLILCGYIEWRWRCTTIYIDVGSVCDTILHGGKLENIYYPNTKRRHRTHYRYSVFQFSFYRYGVSRSQTVLYSSAVWVSEVFELGILLVTPGQWNNIKT